MAKIKGIKGLPYSRGTVYLMAAAIVTIAIAFATVTHADEHGKRSDQLDRQEREGHGLFVNIAAKLNFLPEMSLVINHDSNINVHGATVTATSTSGLTAATVTPPLTFLVQTDASTTFNVKGFGKGSLADIAVGDTVNFRGIALSGTTTSTWTVKATHVEDKTHRIKPPKVHATSTANVNATTTAQFRIDALTKVIERLQAIVAELKIRFGL